MRALVTGGAGFIGSHIVDRLMGRGVEVRILDSLNPRVHPRGKPDYLPGAAEFIQGDVADPRAVRTALRDVDVVFHQAAYQDYMQDFSRFFMVNAVGTALLYETIVEHRLPVRKVIVASSQSVYGEGQYRCPADGFFLAEPRQSSQLAGSDWDVRCPSCGRPADPLPLQEAHPNPGSAYGVSKLSQEMAALRLGRLHGIPSVALRYSITQGARQSHFNAYSGVLRIFTQKLLKGEAPILFEDGAQQRDYTHVDDVVDAAMLVMDEPRADYEAFNVGARRITTVRQYAKLLADRLHFEGEPKQTNEYRVGDNRHGVSSVEKLMALGWKPRKSLDHILDDYLTWIRARPIEPGITDLADRAMRERGVVLKGASRGRAAGGARRAAAQGATGRAVTEAGR
ncbi:MAG TPA: NAD-dependent epimerase/dehydratase family protein [Candidatus Polarisedimenticolia bacterium]|jgi:dTDP-L-rhamnose 4-epimerase